MFRNRSILCDAGNILSTGKKLGKPDDKYTSSSIVMTSESPRKKTTALKSQIKTLQNAKIKKA